MLLRTRESILIEVMINYNALYAVQSAVSATAGLVFLPVVLNVAGVIQRLHCRLHLKLTISNLNMLRNMRQNCD